MLRSFLRPLLASALAATLLAACGGGGGSTEAPAPEPAPSGTSTVLQVSGTVTGFGSVIIDGQRFDDQAASVKVDTNPAAPATGTLSDVKLGMQVEGRSSGGVLSDVTIRATLVGEVGAVDVAGSSFMVYRQTVGVVASGSNPTVFEGTSGLAAVTVGDVVEVHGTVDANQQIVATRVERKARSDTGAGVRLGGLVASLDSSAKTFRLNDLTVNYGSATVLPASATLSNGQIVAVFAQQAPASGVLVAKGIKVAGADEGTAVGVGGRVMAFTSIANFTISGIRVDASSASFGAGTAADVAVGVVVAVEGTVTGGVLKASKARVLKTPEDAKASLAGPVTDFVSSSSFKVRGAAVDASLASFTGGTAADLGNGANVKVTGKVRGDLVKADTVEFVAPPAGGPVKLKGEVRDYNATASTFHFLGANLKLASTVEFVGGALADMANGKRVEVTATKASDSDTLNVSKLEFLAALAPQVSVLAGRVDALTSSGFKLPGVDISFNNTTVFSGGVVGDLGNGIEVLVTGVWNAQQRALVASRIEIRKPEDRPVGVGVRGAISDLVSRANLRVGMQKVDASEATLVDGTEADLANGRLVEGVGSLAGAEGSRYVKLTRLRFLK